jgi:hypothetical protein
VTVSKSRKVRKAKAKKRRKARKRRKVRIRKAAEGKCVEETSKKKVIRTLILKCLL